MKTMNLKELNSRIQDSMKKPRYSAIKNLEPLALKAMPLEEMEQKHMRGILDLFSGS